MFGKDPSFIFIYVENLEMMISLDVTETTEMFEMMNVIKKQKVGIWSHHLLHNREFKKANGTGRIQSNQRIGGAKLLKILLKQIITDVMERAVLDLSESVYWVRPRFS